MSKQYKEIKRLEKELKRLRQARDSAKAMAEAAGERRAVLEGNLPLGSLWGEAQCRVDRVEQELARWKKSR